MSSCCWKKQAQHPIVEVNHMPMTIWWALRLHGNSRQSDLSCALSALTHSFFDPLLILIGSSWGEFDRLAFKVEGMEAMAAATAQVSAASGGDARQRDAGARLLSLESDSQVKAELAALKQGEAGCRGV